MGTHHTIQTITMKILSVILILSVIAGALTVTTPRPRCPGFECPNDDMEGGLFQLAPCNPDFCDCSYGIPYLKHCEGPLVFDESSQVCNWCYNMCDACGPMCPGC